MIEIGKMQYNKLSRVLENIKTAPTFALAIVDGFIDGVVLTDSEYQESYLIGTNNGTYFVCGEPNKIFVDQLQNYYSKMKSERFTIFTPNDEWKNIISNLVTKQSKIMKRKLFTLNQDKFLSAYSSNNRNINFEIQPINKNTIMKSDIFDQQYYLRNWGDLNKYLKNGFGFCATNDNEEVVSECTSIFRSKSKVEIDIYTSENARGNGLAHKLANVFIHQCLEQKVLPSWDCDISNKPSLHLAEELKFDQGEEYTIFHK
ncbi:GNAT family N-acetyltransferase [Virgibacillus ainsalahensis]